MSAPSHVFVAMAQTMAFLLPSTELEGVAPEVMNLVVDERFGRSFPFLTAYSRRLSLLVAKEAWPFQEAIAPKPSPVICIRWGMASLPTRNFPMCSRSIRYSPERLGGCGSL